MFFPIVVVVVFRELPEQPNQTIKKFILKMNVRACTFHAWFVNTLHSGINKRNIHCLQLIQKAAARLLTRTASSLCFPRLVTCEF